MLSRAKLIAIAGPTASGKTSLSIALAKKYNGEIVSADSRQIYRGMTIGTAKVPISPPPRIPMRGNNTKSSISGTVVRNNAKQASGTPVYSEDIPHHLIDIRNPDEDYTVADFKRDASAAIQDISARGKLPFLVGGTGLYVRAVVDNLDIPPIQADPALRKKIEREIATDGLPAVFKRLVALDPEAAYIVDPKNPRRVIRALEVTILTGKPFTASHRKNDPLFDTLTLGITQPDDILRQRIDSRIDDMMRDGLVKEVRSLIKKYGPQQAAFDAIGYREIIDALRRDSAAPRSKTLMDNAVSQMKLNTWHFAKRQMTWFRKDKTIRWITTLRDAEREVEDFLANRKK